VRSIAWKRRTKLNSDCPNTQILYLILLLLRMPGTYPATHLNDHNGAAVSAVAAAADTLNDKRLFTL